MDRQIESANIELGEQFVTATGSSRWKSVLKNVLVRVVKLVVLGALLGLLQGWLAASTYRPDRVAGFFTGFLHGMLMPAALPGLLLGQRVPIYAPNNSGNSYEIGFIAGINICGVIFFGTAFRQGKKGRGVPQG